MDKAADFCELTGQHDLLAYLGLKGDVAPEDAVERLRDRRRLVQGLQANAKYAQEARFLMRHFGDLELVLSNPAMHLEDMRARRIRFGMPTMVAQVQGMLRYGDLSADQMQALRDRAAEMGFSASDFRTALEKAGVNAKPARSETLPVAPPPAEAPPDEVATVEVSAPPPPEPGPQADQFPMADTRPSQAEPLPDTFTPTRRTTTATTPVARAESPKPVPAATPVPPAPDVITGDFPTPLPKFAMDPIDGRDPLDEPTPIIPALQPLVSPVAPAAVVQRPMWEESWFRATGAVLGIVVALGVGVLLVWIFVGFNP